VILENIATLEYFKRRRVDEQQMLHYCFKEGKMNEEEIRNCLEFFCSRGKERS